MAVIRNYAAVSGRGATFVKNGQMLLKNLSWIGKIVKISEMLLKNTFCLGKYALGKSPGGQKFWQQGGGGRFCEILSCPLKYVLPLKCPLNSKTWRCH